MELDATRRGGPQVAPDVLGPSDPLARVGAGPATHHGRRTV